MVSFKKSSVLLLTALSSTSFQVDILETLKNAKDPQPARW